MKEIVQSEWFALVSGVASVLGVLLTLYQFRIKDTPYSKLRAMEWRKNIIVSLGIGIFIASFIQFYNQPPPGLIPLRDAYDIIHGKIGGHIWDDGWREYSGLGFNTQESYVEVKSIFISNDLTQFSFHIIPLEGVSLQKDYDPFKNAVVKTNYFREYKPIEKNIYPTQNGRLEGFINFPSIKASNRLSFSITEFQQGKLVENAKFAIDFDKRELGTSLWGILMILSFFLALIGMSYNPFFFFKSQIMREYKDSHDKRYKELDKILNGRTYEELSFHEKQKYDQTSAFYAKTQEMIFKTLSGESINEPNSTKNFPKL